MSDVDTSNEAGERLAKIMEQWPTLAATLRALLAERERLRAERDAAHLACEMAFKALAEARNEIERLRAEIVLLEATGAEAADEIERLRAALRQIANNTGCVEACPCWSKLRHKAERALLTEGEP